MDAEILFVLSGSSLTMHAFNPRTTSGCYKDAHMVQKKEQDHFKFRRIPKNAPFPTGTKSARYRYAGFRKYAAK